MVLSESELKSDESKLMAKCRSMYIIRQDADESDSETSSEEEEASSSDENKKEENDEEVN